MFEPINVMTAQAVETLTLPSKSSPLLFAAGSRSINVSFVIIYGRRFRPRYVSTLPVDLFTAIFLPKYWLDFAI
jgi:hypothetical protein